MSELDKGKRFSADDIGLEILYFETESVKQHVEVVYEQIRAAGIHWSRRPVEMSGTASPEAISIDVTLCERTLTSICY